MNILPLLNRLLLPTAPPRGVTALRRLRSASAIDSLEEASVAEERPGCGWFDSSHDLQHGLVVTEFEQPDAVAQLVPLGWWLEWQVGAGLPALTEGAATAPPFIPALCASSALSGHPSQADGMVRAGCLQ